MEQLFKNYFLEELFPIFQLITDGICKLLTALSA
jgi:hypothetical protein